MSGSENSPCPVALAKTAQTSITSKVDFFAKRNNRAQHNLLFVQSERTQTEHYAEEYEIALASHGICAR